MTSYFAKHVLHHRTFFETQMTQETIKLQKDYTIFLNNPRKSNYALLLLPYYDKTEMVDMIAAWCKSLLAKEITKVLDESPLISLQFWVS